MSEDFIPLPQPFTLNRGTAVKWIAALRSGQWLCDSAQLGYYGPDGAVYRSPEGVLCETVRAPQTTAWDGVSVLFNGAQFFASESVYAAAKARGRFPEWPTFERAAVVLEHWLESRVES